jgi:hypothetical protein
METLASRFWKSWLGNEFWWVLKKFYENNRNLNALNEKDENILLQGNVVFQIETIDKNGIALDVHVEKQQYYKFLFDLYDVDKKDIYIPTRWGNVHIPFTKKQLTSPYSIAKVAMTIWDEWYSNPKDISIGKILDMHNFPIQFEIDYGKMNEEDRKILKLLIGPSYLDEQEFTNSEGRKEKMTFSDRTLVKLTDKYGHTYTWYLSARGFGTGNTNIDSENGNKTNAQLDQRLFLYSEPVDKIQEAPVERDILVAKNQNGWDLTSPTGKKVPVYIDYDNPHADYSVEVLDQKLAIGGDAVQNISTWYLYAQSDTNTQWDRESVDTLAEKLEQANLWENLEESQIDSKNHVDESDDTNNEWSKNWNKFWWGFDFIWISPKNKEELEKKWPQVGQRIWFCQQEKVDVPPNTGNRSSIKIDKVNYDDNGNIIDVRFSLTGWSKSLGKSEGKSYTFDANQFEWLMIGLQGDREITSGKKMIVMDETNNHKDFANMRDAIKWWVSRSKMDDIENLDIKNGKLYRQDTTTIDYFVSTDVPKYPQEIKNEKGDIVKKDNDYTIRYKVDTLKNGKFKVEAENRYFYNKEKNQTNQLIWSREMDMQTFLMFLSEKNLKPKSKEETEVIKNADKTKGEISWEWLNPPQLLKRSRSFSDMLNVGKKMISGVKDKYDKYQKDVQEEAEWRLFGEFRLWDKLGNMVPDWMTDRDMNIFHELNWDYDTDIAKQRSWKKVEWWIQYYEKLQHVQARIEIADDIKKTLALQKAWGNSNVPYRQRIIMAAASVYMLDKGKWPYAFSPTKENEFPNGTWVRVVLGEQMYTLYQKVYEGEKLKATKDGMEIRDQMDILSTLEHRFLAEVTGQGKHGNLMKEYYPGSSIGELPGQRWDYTKIYSRKYSSAIREKLTPYQEWKTLQDSDITDFENSKDFSWVEGQFVERLEQNRKWEAIAAFIALSKLCRSAPQCRLLAKYACMWFTSWVFNHNIPLALRGRLRKELRSCKFWFGNYILEWDVNEKISGLLDFITEGDFTWWGEKWFWYDIKNYSEYNYNLWKKQNTFRNDFNSRWGKHQGDIEKFIFIQDPKSTDSVVSLARPINPPADPWPKVYKGKELTANEEKICKNFYFESYNKTREINELGLSFFEGDPWITQRDAIEKVTKAGVSPQGEWTKDSKNNANDDAFAAMNFWGAMKKEMSTVTTDICSAPQDKHRIYFYLTHFFNIFEWVGQLWDGRFGEFYQCIAQAKKIKADPNYTPKQKEKEIKRLIRFVPYSGAFSDKQDLPDEIKIVLDWFCTFIDNNLDHIDAEGIGLYHDGGKYADSFKNTDPYIPHHIWKNLGERDNYLTARNIQARETINYKIDAENDKSRRGIGSAGAKTAFDTRIGFIQGIDENNPISASKVKLQKWWKNKDLELWHGLRVVANNTGKSKTSRTRSEVESMLDDAGYREVSIDLPSKNSFSKKEIQSFFDNRGIPMPGNLGGGRVIPMNTNQNRRQAA